MKTVNTKLYDNAVRHQIGIVRFSTHSAQSLVGQFNSLVPKLLGMISAYDASGAMQVDHAILATDALIDQSFASITESLDKFISDLSEHEVEHNVNVIEAALPIDTVRGIKASKKPKPNSKPSSFRPGFGFVIGVPSRDQVYAAIHARPFQGKHLRDYYNDLPGTVKASVSKTIRQGYADGRTTDEIVRSLRGSRSSKFTDGILQQSRRSIERLTRTALNHTANVARDQIYQRNDDLISGVRWVSTLDTRTSDTCIALDGQVFPADSGPRPPAHLNCRSCTTPIVKSWRELGFDIDELPEATRASMDGQVPATETYGTWLGRQSDATQDDVLGPTRAALFRDGGLTVDKFVDDVGNTLTLDQLRSREASAFAKIDA